MFNTFIAQPIFNLLVFIYAIIPGHNFGLAIIIFTIVVRLLLWPLLKKQLHQTKVMRKLAPELKRIKKEAKGDRQKESLMTMELYKEQGVNPFGSIGLLIVQLPILFALYHGLARVVKDPHQIVEFAYPFLQQFSWMQQLADNIHQFDTTLFGFVDLTKSALSNGGVYWPAMIIVVASAVAQYFQTKQLLPQDKEARSLRAILRQAGEGKQADQAEVNAAIGRSTRYLLPVMIFLFTVNIASALSLYWLVGGIIAFIQQSLVLRDDETEMAEIAGDSKKDIAAIPEAEVIEEKPQADTKLKNKKKKSNRKSRKRRSK